MSHLEACIGITTTNRTDNYSLVKAGPDFIPVKNGKQSETTVTRKYCIKGDDVLDAVDKLKSLISGIDGQQSQITVRERLFGRAYLAFRDNVKKN